MESLAPAQRAIESVIIAVITSTGLYLVGSVYTEAYYSRMSIDATSLDLAPPYIALQSMHVVQSLIEYPLTLLLLFALYRILRARVPQLHSWYDAVHGRFGRLFLLIVNLVVIAPLVAAALRAGFERDVIFSNSILGEVAELMSTFGVILLLYAIWLSVGPRLSILGQVRQRRLIPIALLFVLYLLDALIGTAHRATRDAELLMLGISSSSIAVDFTLASDIENALPDTGLILVIIRGGTYYVVERQEYPPSPRPVAYAIPSGAVRSARLQRVTDVEQEISDFLFELERGGTPASPR